MGLPASLPAAAATQGAFRGLDPPRKPDSLSATKVLYLTGDELGVLLLAIPFAGWGCHPKAHAPGSSFPALCGRPLQAQSAHQHKPARRDQNFREGESTPARIRGRTSGGVVVAPADDILCLYWSEECRSSRQSDQLLIIREKGSSDPVPHRQNLTLTDVCASSSNLAQPCAVCLSSVA